MSGSQHSRAELEAQHSASRWAARSGAMGSMLEFYDFFIYTQAAALVFPHVFFPAGHPTLAIIASLATFGVGYVARPVGAFVLGWLGDRKGRKFTLILTMDMMGISTIAVGFLPSFHQVGILAPILLVILRLVQGFAVAGEISSSSTMILEQTPMGIRGLRASASLQGAQLGQIFAALLFIPLSAFLSEADFQGWGWRVPFFLSAILVYVGYRIRLHTLESKPDENDTVPPIRRVFRESKRTLLCVFLMALTNIIPVTATVFGATLATNAAYGVNWSPSVYLWIPVLGNVVAVIIIPRVARLSDRFGRRPTMLVGTVIPGMLSFAYLWAILNNNVWLTLVIALVMWGTLYQGYNAVFPSFFPELFPASTRVTGMSIAQNIGTAVSSLMAMVFAAIVPVGSSASQIIGYVGGLTLVITILAALAAWFSPETSRIPGPQLGTKDAKPLPEAEYLELREHALSMI